MRYKLIKKVKYFIPAIIWMIVIFLFSSQVGRESSKNNHFIVDVLNKLNIEVIKQSDYEFLNFLIRKTAHITEYLILFMLLYYAFRKIKLKNEKIKVCIFTVLYACTDEFHQLFIHGRTGKITDVFIDSIGIIIGIIIIYIFKYCKHLRKSRN
ncbi:VanZ family protein [Haloimpatiens sp. FM7330]|uniref:VanZ family protein n=1 Tax=Haloimpatiens sp. FM7330 TaxID=3298610 RepID=UPI003634A3D5